MMRGRSSAASTRNWSKSWIEPDWEWAPRPPRHEVRPIEFTQRPRLAIEDAAELLEDKPLQLGELA